MAALFVGEADEPKEAVKVGSAGKRGDYFLAVFLFFVLHGKRPQVAFFFSINHFLSSFFFWFSCHCTEPLGDAKCHRPRTVQTREDV